MNSAAILREDDDDDDKDKEGDGAYKESPMGD